MRKDVFVPVLALISILGCLLFVSCGGEEDECSSGDAQCGSIAGKMDAGIKICESGEWTVYK